MSIVMANIINKLQVLMARTRKTTCKLTLPLAVVKRMRRERREVEERKRQVEEYVKEQCKIKETLQQIRFFGTNIFVPKDWDFVPKNVLG